MNRINLLCEKATLHLRQAHPGLAKESLEEAEALARSQNPPLEEEIIAMGWAEYYLDRKAYPQARARAERAWVLIGSKENFHHKQQTANYLYQAFKGLGDPGKALAFLELEKSFTDSLLNKENIRELAVAQYQAEKENLISQTQQQQQLLLAEQKARTTQRNAFLGGMLALGVILFVLYRNGQIKAKANQELAERNAKIEAQKEELGELNRVKDRIFAILGHDLRKPALAFRSLSCKLSYLISKNDYSTLQKVGHQLEADADSLHALTDNILYWALSQQKGYVFRPMAFDLAESVEEVVKIFQRAAEGKSIILENQIHEQTLVMADPHATQAVLRNLLDNSLKFTPIGGRIILSASEEGENVAIRVQDTGEGIPLEQQASLFSAPAQSKTGTAGEQGTGLGLQLIRELVQRNQGEIVIYSEVKVGTVVEIKLPRAA